MAITTDVDIVITGAGPTGLFTALLARQQGLSVAVFDKRPGPLDLGRADALNARTQQIYDVAGVLEDLRKLGITCNTSSIFKDGTFASRNSHWWTSLEHTRYKEFLMIGQAAIEKVLFSHLDIDVHYDTEVDSMVEGVYGVTTTYGSNSIRSKYAVAADGAHSATRKSLGIQFLGDKPNMKWSVLDTFLKTDFPVCNEIINFEENGQSRVSWIPRERGMARFYILLEGEVNQERSEDAIRRNMAPHKVEFERTEWWSTYDVQERVAETFVSPERRIILAGDAAHVHAVNGGQGLNTGASDAFALAWRLGLSVKYPKLANALLESYDHERRTTAQGVVSVAGKLVRSTLRTAQEYVSLVEKNAANITGMGITYSGTSKAIIEGKSGLFTAGARCPDFELKDTHGKIVRFYELIAYGQFVLLRHNGGGLPNYLDTDLQTAADLWEFKREGQGWKVACGSGEVYETDFDFGFSPESSTEETIIVRPDLYVGCVGGAADQYFKSLSQE